MRKSKKKMKCCRVSTRKEQRNKTKKRNRERRIRDEPFGVVKKSSKISWANYLG